MPADPDAIVAAARVWLGVPWRHQGRTRQGVDCAGLVVLVGRGLGLADYDTCAYGRRPEGQGFVQHFRAAMDGLSLPEAGPGDVLMADQGATVHEIEVGPFAEKARAGVEEMEADGVWSAGLWQEIRDMRN